MMSSANMHKNVAYDAWSCVLDTLSLGHVRVNMQRQAICTAVCEGVGSTD